MKKKVVVMVVLGMLLAAFQAWGAEPTTADKKIDISKMTCKELMGGDDTDREVGTAFFHGFMAGKKDNTIVDVKKTSALSDKVKDYCLSNPTSTVMEAFKKSSK
jgi:hypothetical protein